MGFGRVGHRNDKTKKKPTTAEIALRADKKANKALRAEEKKWQYYAAPLVTVFSNASAAGSSILFGNGMATGSAYNQRSGVEIVCKSIKGNWVIERAGLDCTYRMLVVWDKEITINPSSTAFIPEVNSTEVTVSDFNPDARGKFQVLYDSGPIALHSNNPLHTHSFARKIEKKSIFQQNTTTLTKGGLRMIFYSDIGTGSPAFAPVLNYQFKFKYTE